MDFTDLQLTTLHAAVDRIIPPDDYPGAWEAGVGDYLVRQFVGDLKSLLPLYQSGLDALNAEAVAQYGAAFADLPPEQQDALLQKVENGAVQTEWPVTPQRFFRTLVNHTAEGYYSDPGNGGNHNGISWQMIGFQSK